MHRLLWLLALLLFAPVAQAQVSFGSDVRWTSEGNLSDPAPTDNRNVFEISGGQERILNFNSDIRIQPDGVLDVTETIRVAVLNLEIKHGLQRDFPTRYWNDYGQRVSVGFQVLSVMMNGQPEPYEVLGISNGDRIRIGRADVTLQPGVYTYAIRYRTTRQLRFHEDRDEIYWNVTGNGWTFPIDNAEARITLPGAKWGARAVYTGPQGSTAANAAVVEEGTGTIIFRTTAPLSREEGLTVAVDFQKGLVAPPSAAEQMGWWWQEWGTLIASVAATLSLIAFYIVAYVRIGRGPRAGPVVPRFSPPEGLSAAACRFIDKMQMDDRAFTAAIIQSAIGGHVRIRKEEGQGWFSSDTTSLSRIVGTNALPAGEAAMVDTLFDEDRSIELKQENHARLQKARTALADRLSADYEGTLFLQHKKWAWYGLLATISAMVFGSLIGAVVGLSPLPASWPIIALGCTALLIFIIEKMLQIEGGKGLWWVAVVGVAIAAAVFSAGSILGALSEGQWPVLLPILVLPVTFTAFKWIAAPTREGRRVMDEIAGFRHYLGITEEDRLDALHPPDKTPELFERYLPHAIALDVENRWAKRFASVLAAAAAAGTATTAWYVGNHSLFHDPDGFTKDVGSSLASTVASAATSPSSSGSGGGGSSGGGGGGGGGSGW